MKEFAIISNLQLNESKSQAIPINLNEDIRGSLQQFAQFEWNTKHFFHYIGVNVSLTPNSAVSNLETQLPKIERIMFERNQPDCSILGRVLILKSLVSSHLVYPFLLAGCPVPH